MAHLTIANCRLPTTGNRLSTIRVRDGRIAAIEPASPCTTDSCLNAQGRLLAPGFIDVHIQGAGGCDVLDATPDALRKIAAVCARFGTTSFLATTVYRPQGNNKHLDVCAGLFGQDLGGANMLGIHLEGPFISPGKRGMIQPDGIGKPSSDTLDQIFGICQGHLSMMTIAPELEGCLGLVRTLADCGVVASLGHTLASYEQSLDGIRAGITHATHLFNAMPSLHHRTPGPLAAIFESRNVSVQVIPDGVHLHPAVVRMAFELLGSERFVSITDGIQAMGLGDGSFVYNGIPYKSIGGAARYKDGTLIGTALGLGELLPRVMHFTDCSLETAIQTMTESPARAIGVFDRKGSIQVGKDADLVLLNEDLSVWKTMVDGRIAYQAEAGMGPSR